VAKSYLPQLVRWLKKICVYIIKHQVTLNSYLTPTQQGYLSAVVTACTTFTNSVNVQTTEGP
jgi:hypothetical protein